MSPIRRVALLATLSAVLVSGKKVVVQVKDGDQLHMEHIYGQNNQQVGQDSTWLTLDKHKICRFYSA